MLGSGYVSRVCFGVCFGGMFRVCFAASGATLPAISGVCYGVCFGGMFRGMLRGMFRGCATRVPFLNLSPPKKHKPIYIYIYIYIYIFICLLLIYLFIFVYSLESIFEIIRRQHIDVFLLSCTTPRLPAQQPAPLSDSSGPARLGFRV